MDYTFLLSVAVIILSTKFLGGISQKVHMPQVVGALVAGVVLGPSLLGFVEETDFIAKSAEIGVIMLMFMAGLDTDIKEIKKNSVSFVVIATMGVLIPLIGGFGAYYFYFNVDSGNFNDLLSAVFIGVVLTATSVSITVEALREMGKLQGKVGNAILGAAVIDDIMGIIILTVVTSLKDSSVSIASILIKIALYVVVMVVVAIVLNASRPTVDQVRDRRRISIYVMALLLIISFVTEHFFGIADITGAYLLGLCMSSFEIREDIAKKMTVPGYMFFSPIFFASIGIKTDLHGMNKDLLVFSMILLVIAILSKVVGCGVGAKLCGYNSSDSLNIGIGMISRGEVALIVAQKGYNMGLLDSAIFSPIVLVVIVTTIITPVLLKKCMK